MRRRVSRSGRFRGSGRSRQCYLLASTLPLLLIAVSLALAPRLFETRLFADEINPLAQTPVLLYRRGMARVYYTSLDLLHPQQFSRPRELVEAVFFDVWPAKEGHATPLEKLTWIEQIATALASDAGSDVDRRTLTDFLTSFSGPPQLERGTTRLFPVPVGSSYRQVSGVSTFVAMAIKDPAQRDVDRAAPGTNPSFERALGTGFNEVKARGISKVGVPFMFVPDLLGQSVSRNRSWTKLLDHVGRAADQNGVRVVVLGGFGIVPESREKTDLDFRQAWRDWKLLFESERRRPEHEKIRLAAVASFCALLSAAGKMLQFSLRRAVALLVLAGSLAGSVPDIIGAIQPMFPPLQHPVANLVLSGLLAAAAGLFLDTVVKFEPKKEV